MRIPSTKRILTRALALSALAALGPSAIPHAYCGLEYCPVPIRPEHPTHWTAGFAWRVVHFRQGAAEVSLQQLATRLEWRPVSRLVLGADIPVTVPISASTHALGFSNPLLFAEASVSLPWLIRLSMGSQVELPYGDVSGGFASGHAMWIPYVSVGRAIASFSLSARMGWSTAIPYHPAEASSSSAYDDPLGDGTPSAGTAMPAIADIPAHAAHAAYSGHTAHASHPAHDPGPTPHSASFIEPHADRDLLYRLGAGWKTPIAAAEIHFSGAHALEASFSPRHFLSAGLSLEFPFGSHLSIVPELRLPLTHPARFQSAGGVGIRTVF